MKIRAFNLVPGAVFKRQETDDDIHVARLVRLFSDTEEVSVHEGNGQIEWLDYNEQVELIGLTPNYEESWDTYGNGLDLGTN